jgi:hypothetical protein
VTSRVAPRVLLVLVTGLSFYPLCGAFFRCGCASLGAGAADHCNVHAREGPHCPWCDRPALGAVGLGVTLAGQAAAFSVSRRRGATPTAGLLAAILALPLAALLAGALTFLATDYPHFLTREARSSLGLPRGPISTRAPAP